MGTERKRPRSLFPEVVMNQKQIDSAPPPLPRLGADYSRCKGKIATSSGDEGVACPQRESCVRFLVPPVSGHPRQAFIVVSGDDQVGNCSEFWPK